MTSGRDCQPADGGTAPSGGQADGSTFPAAALALAPPANPPIVFRVAERSEPG